MMMKCGVLCAALLLAACGGGGASAPPVAGAPALVANPPPPDVLPAVPQGVGIQLAADQIMEPPMVAIPAGSFEWNGVARTIAIPAFQMGKYEVTVGQWRQFVLATGFRSRNPTCWKLANTPARIELGNHSWDAPQFEQNEFHPVTCVSDADATAYMGWLPS